MASISAAPALGVGTIVAGQGATRPTVVKKLKARVQMPQSFDALSGVHALLGARTKDEVRTVMMLDNDDDERC